jgi:hypothetical protein
VRALKRIVPVIAIALFVGAALAGCGGDDSGKPIPVATATALNNELNNVQARLDNGSAGACRDILEGARGPNRDRVNELIDAMPDDVDSDVRSALQDSFDNLWDLVQRECDDRQSKEDERKQQQQQQEEEPEQDTTPTDTTPTDTTPTDTTPTDTTPTDEAPLPNDGDGDSGGGVPGTGGNDLPNGGGVSPGADVGGG